MIKFALINVIGTLVLAGVLSAAQVNPTLAASPTSAANPADMVAAKGTAQVMLVEYAIQQEAPDLIDKFLDLSPADRDQLLFRLADERSMRLLGSTNATTPAGPMNAR